MNFGVRKSLFRHLWLVLQQPTFIVLVKQINGKLLHLGQLLYPSDFRLVHNRKDLRLYIFVLIGADYVGARGLTAPL